MLFNELSHDAQSAAVDGFIKGFNEYLGIQEQSHNKKTIHAFLSRSRVHCYDEYGKLLGRLTPNKKCRILRKKILVRRRGE